MCNCKNTKRERRDKTNSDETMIHGRVKERMGQLYYCLLEVNEDYAYQCNV